MKTIRGTLLLLSCLYLTLYIPFFSVTYFPSWYEFNCRLHSRCFQIGLKKSNYHIHELVGFFRHKNQLAHPEWTQKEKHHLAEVRAIFDKLFSGAVIAASLIFLIFDRKRLKLFSLINLFFILSASAIIPFFSYFWRHVFHKLMFDNYNWINFPSDVSYYITPRVFFLYTIILIILISTMINLCLFLVFRKYACKDKFHAPVVLFQLMVDYR